jgi:hypothetical protein
VNTLTTNNTFSIVLFALVDANYKFMFVDVGSQGRIADSGVVTNTELYKIWKQKPRLSQPMPFNGREKRVPYFFIGVEAFPLIENLIKGYPGQHSKASKERIFN